MGWDIGRSLYGDGKYKAFSFQKIQAKLTDQIFYWYSGKGQSANETLPHWEYDVVNAKLQYTYTTAYQEPKHAWLVPAWIFTVREVLVEFSTIAFLCDQCL